MSEPTSPRPDAPTTEPPAPVNGASPSYTKGLSTLPEKRPHRRFFGLLSGKRK